MLLQADNSQSYAMRNGIKYRTIPQQVSTTMHNSRIERIKQSLHDEDTKMTLSVMQGTTTQNDQKITKKLVKQDNSQQQIKVVNLNNKVVELSLTPKITQTYQNNKTKKIDRCTVKRVAIDHFYLCPRSK